MMPESASIAANQGSVVSAAGTGPPTQFYTEHECRRLFKLNILVLAGSFALSLLAPHGGFAVTLFLGLNLFRIRKVEKEIRAGKRIPKPATYTPKRIELWLWPPFIALITAAMLWVVKTDILPHLQHPASSLILFAAAVISLLYLSTAWLALLWNVRQRYRRYFAAKQGTGLVLDEMPSNVAPVLNDTTPAAQSELPVQKPHWWTDTQAREEMKVTARR